LVPAAIGALARSALWRAVTLSPRSRIACGDGPIQIRDRQADSIHTVYQRVRSGGEESAGQEQRT